LKKKQKRLPGNTGFTDEDSYKYKKLIIPILEKNGFKTQDSDISDMHQDITYQHQKGIVEIKFYRNKLAILDLILLACQRLLDVQNDDSDKIPLLIISSNITDPLKREIKNKFGIIIWDIKELFGLAFNFSEQYYQLSVFLFKIFNESVDEFSIVNEGENEKIISDFTGFQKPTVKPGKIVELEGNRLKKELKAIPPGKRKKSSTLFEEKCVEILKYLFKTELELWEEQSSTEDRLHRMDLLCRLCPSGRNFWEELLNDFHSRYIVFEFKNYSEKIKQGQIYTTEKYLFKTALRSIAFIIAKNGGDTHACQTARGALREAGKLIIILTAEELCDMLDMKDRGEDPSVPLREKVNDVLIKINR
jgi:hypothetical protein